MNKIVFFACVLLAAGCKEKFVSPAPVVPSGYLVVEGIVNNEGASTTIRLSRTNDLNSVAYLAEKGAAVTLEDSNNVSLTLAEGSDGSYIIDNLHLDTARRYRLTINTANSEQYVSDYVPVRNNPPIDSINWVRENDGVHIFINTHDPGNKTIYYQWDYNETWEIHSHYSTDLKYVKAPPPDDNRNIGVTFRDANDPQIYFCWQFNPSTSLLLGSSEKLSQDIIHLPLRYIPKASIELSVLYSTVIRQYSWSRDGYEFLQRMKKNTESVGSVFDAQPSELNTNFHCVNNPKQPVIGFFNICTIREKRIFIRNNELPGWGYSMNCPSVIIENNADSILKKGGGMLPTSVAKTGTFGSIITFNASLSDCVDCTLSGTNTKPSYWP